VDLYAIDFVFSDVFLFYNTLTGLSQGDATHRNYLNVGLLTCDAKDPREDDMSHFQHYVCSPTTVATNLRDIEDLEDGECGRVVGLDSLCGKVGEGMEGDEVVMLGEWRHWEKKGPCDSISNTFYILGRDLESLHRCGYP